ncbi:hypothetical protein ACIOKD_37340 [Streptomyces sp. NPDC087844]|uniref:hypothetical protein n=1 Tax=Streptomyces sp. NPDC087844 TaxID=3365805 RepID=UPI003828C0F9
MNTGPPSRTGLSLNSGPPLRTGLPWNAGLPWAVLRLHRAALAVWGAFLLAAIGTLVWEAGIIADSVQAEVGAYVPAR